MVVDLDLMVDHTYFEEKHFACIITSLDHIKSYYTWKSALLLAIFCFLDFLLFLKAKEGRKTTFQEKKAFSFLFRSTRI